MMKQLNVCIAQMCSHNKQSENISQLAAIADYAKQHGCQLIALPEASGLMNANVDEAKLQIREAKEDLFIARCQHIASTNKLWIHTGSTPVLGKSGKFLNQTQCIDDQGVIRSTYNKIHLFDAYLEGQNAITESARYESGDSAVLQSTPWGTWGMAICYDLRFPQLFRQYAQAGASVVFVPSAFTVRTGRAHWEALLRARAIENGLWIIAAAQVGKHADGRESWGHSLVINPWGEILLDLGGDEPSCAHITLELDQVRQARNQIPSLQNDREYSFRVEA